MTRSAVCTFAFLFSSFALAQVPAPSSAPTQAISTAAPGTQQFQTIEQAWDNAINARDQYALENILSPLFVDVAASGDITTRNQQLAFLIANEDKTLHITQKVITVRLMGDIAVANGTYVLHHKTLAGNQVDEKGVFTQVFEKAKNGWVCMNSQRTLLREDNGKAKKQTDSAFHFPLFSKGEEKK